MKTLLFTDFRHIQCGDLYWFTDEGQGLSLRNPPSPMVAAVAKEACIPHGIRLAAQPGTRSDTPVTGPRGGSIIFENNVYRSWNLEAGSSCPQNAAGAAATAGVEIVCTESADGLTWKEKSCSRIETPGWKGFDGFAVFVDTNPQATPAERYKAVFMAYPPVEQKETLFARYRRLHPRYHDTRITDPDTLTCLYAAVSPDGYTWQAVVEPILIHYSDTDTSVYYDAGLDRYVMYTRLYVQDRRWIGRAETAGFYHWEPVNPMLWPDLTSPYTDIYRNGYTTYPGLPEYRFLFPMFYSRHTQGSEVRIFSSDDGTCWNAIPGGPVLRPGEPDCWDGEYIGAEKNLVPFGKDRVALAYFGTRYPHKYPRWKPVLDAMWRGGWVTWPKGRLCAVTADEEGEFHTFPMRPAGRQLRLNVRTRRAGLVRVGITGLAGRSVEECDPIFGDHLEVPVRWKGQTDIGLSVNTTAPVVLHIKLRAAELFGLEWE